jgi:hypothetical protein
MYTTDDMALKPSAAQDISATKSIVIEEMTVFKIT